MTQTLDAAGLSKGQMMPEKNRFPAVIVPGKSHWDGGPHVFENHGQDSRLTECGDVGPTVHSKYGTGGNNTPLVMAFDTAQITSPGNYSHPKVGDPTPPLNTVAQMHVAVHGVDNENNAFVDVCGPVIAGRSGGGGRPLPAVMVPDVTGWTIRRLTPVECERLQGMGDNHTRIPKRVHASKPRSKHFAKYPHYYDEQPGGTWIQHFADGPRYKAVGNSMAVPCIAWILRGLAEGDGESKTV